MGFNSTQKLIKMCGQYEINLTTTISTSKNNDERLKV